MSALAFVRCGDGVLLCVPGARGMRPCSARCVCQAPAARVRSQRVAVARSSAASGSVASCGSDGVLAVPGGCAKGAEPAWGRARARAAV